MNTITIVCTKEGHNAAQFELTNAEEDNDGTQFIITQYFRAECGCQIAASMVFPNKANA